nr:nucleolar MIF4G domain-containing protein 1 [Tanacetum cinerariifolium]
MCSIGKEKVQKNTRIPEETESLPKLDEFVDIESRKDDISADEDLRLEGKLAKKLKLKNKKSDEEDDVSRNTSKSHKKKKRTVSFRDDDEMKNEKTKFEKYLGLETRTDFASAKEDLDLERRLAKRLKVKKGKLDLRREMNQKNFLKFANVCASISRSDGTQIISEEILTSCSSGPRGNEQYAAVFASLVSGLACLVGIDFGAKLLASLAKCFEDEYEKEDNLSLRNLTLLLSYLYMFGVCSSDLIYDFMMLLSSRLTEVDVSTILTVLNCSGMRLRSDDPATMKSFIVSIQNKVAELKASGDSQGNSRSKRE